MSTGTLVGTMTSLFLPALRALTRPGSPVLTAGTASPSSPRRPARSGSRRGRRRRTPPGGDTSRMQCRCPRRFCSSWIITCRPCRSRQPNPSSMMTLSIGRCCRLAYWPMPSARLTATRNFWLPRRNATLIAAAAGRRGCTPPGPAPCRSPPRRRRRPASGTAARRDSRSSTALRVIDDLPLGLPDEVPLQAVAAEQLGQQLVAVLVLVQFQRLRRQPRPLGPVAVEDRLLLAGLRAGPRSAGVDFLPGRRRPAPSPRRPAAAASSGERVRLLGRERRCPARSDSSRARACASSLYFASVPLRSSSSQLLLPLVLLGQPGRSIAVCRHGFGEQLAGPVDGVAALLGGSPPRRSACPSMVESCCWIVAERPLFEPVDLLGRPRRSASWARTWTLQSVSSASRYSASCRGASPGRRRAAAPQPGRASSRADSLRSACSLSAFVASSWASRSVGPGRVQVGRPPCGAAARSSAVGVRRRRPVVRWTRADLRAVLVRQCEVRLPARVGEPLDVLPAVPASCRRVACTPRGAASWSLSAASNRSRAAVSAATAAAGPAVAFFCAGGRGLQLLVPLPLLAPQVRGGQRLAARPARLRPGQLAELVGRGLRLLGQRAGLGRGLVGLLAGRPSRPSAPPSAGRGRPSPSRRGPWSPSRPSPARRLAASAARELGPGRRRSAPGSGHVGPRSASRSCSSWAVRTSPSGSVGSRASSSSSRFDPAVCSSSVRTLPRWRGQFPELRADVLQPAARPASSVF